MTTYQVSLDQFVASLKAIRDQLSDREAFVARSQSKYDHPPSPGCRWSAAFGVTEAVATIWKHLRQGETHAYP